MLERGKKVTSSMIISLYLRNRVEFGVEFSGNFEFSSVGGLSPVVQ